jgi:hypothetical protein
MGGAMIFARYVLFVLLLAGALPASAATKNVYIQAGQSVALGSIAANVGAQTADNMVSLYYEIGLINDSEYDFTASESPPGDDASLPRWAQSYALVASALKPQVVAGYSRAGPEIAYGRLLFGKYGSGHNTVIAKFAYGGSSLGRHWINSPSVDLADRMLMWLTRLRTSLEADGSLVVFRAFNWIQGPADMRLDADAKAYPENLRALVSRVRRLAGKPNLPVTVSRTNLNLSLAPPEWAKNYPMVRAAQEQFVSTDPCAFLVNEDDLLHDDSGVHYKYLGGSNVIGQRQFGGLELILGRPACR